MSSVYVSLMTPVLFGMSQVTQVCELPQKGLPPLRGKESVPPGQSTAT